MTLKYDQESIQLPQSWKSLAPVMILCGVVLVAVGGLISVFTHDSGGSADKIVPFQFGVHSYLANFMFVMTIAMGSLFFILVQFVARSGWSSSIRRIAELLMTTIPFLAVLFLPILVLLYVNDSTALYSWNNPEKVTNSAVLAKINAGYLTRNYFVLRAAIYFGLWILIGAYYFGQSRKQDESGDVECSLARQKWSGPMIMLFALTASFASFDWVMSIAPAWYSTIFGVYLFAAGMMAFFATMILICNALQRSGKVRDMIKVDHYHDMGKMMFGFIMFWSYIAFSQLLLYWYGNIPEETEWFRFRIENGWEYLSYGLIPLHFAIPFLGTMSRHVRRHRLGLAFWACWVLVVHWLDMTFLILPNVPGGPSFVPMFGHFLGGVGMFSLFIGFFIVRAFNVPLVAVRDPRLPEALTYTNPIL